MYFKSKGSYGVYYGLGLNEIAINFENISGLISLAGENGMGKTTVMEMLSPFDSFPSTKLKDPGGYNLKKQFMTRDSYKEVCYLFNGDRYVFRVEIPAGTTMSPEGYIWRNDIPLVKGKISQYRKKVVELFGSERLFYSSIFSCQGGEKLTDLSAGDFKQLLIELLGLNRYVKYWKDLGKVINICESELNKVLAEIGVYDKVLADTEKYKEQCIDINGRLEVRKLECSQTSDLLIEYRDEIKTLQEQKVSAEKNELLSAEKETQKANINNEITALNRSKAEECEDFEDYKKHRSIDLEQYNRLIKQEDSIIRATAALEQLEEEKEDLQDDINAIDKSIQVKTDTSDVLVASMDQTRDKIDLALKDDQLKKFADAEASLTQKGGEIQAKIEEQQAAIRRIDASPAKSLLQGDIARLDVVAILLNDRPSECQVDTCPFIVDAVKAVKTKEEKQAKIKKIKEEETALTATITDNIKILEGDKEAVTKSLSQVVFNKTDRQNFISSAIMELRKSMAADREKKESLFTDIEKLKTGKKEKTEYLEGIPTRMDALKKLAAKKAELATAKQMVVEINNTVLSRTDAHAKKILDFENAVNKKQGQITQIDSAILFNASTTPSSDYKRQITIKENNLARETESLKTLELSTTELEKQIAVVKAKTKLSDEDQESLTALKKKASFIRKEISQWEYIRAGVSKSGLQALEIAAAAPLLTSLANDLLHSAFGGEFFVDLITQDPDTGAEILEIMITRGDGEAFPLSRYSGGESTWVLQAFKAAQILVNAEKSGVHFKTCFADEETGALDKDKAERFIKMYRALMEKGGFKKFFFISHIQDCQAMADHTLTFEHGGIKSDVDTTLLAQEKAA